MKVSKENPLLNQMNLGPNIYFLVIGLLVIVSYF